MCSSTGCTVGLPNDDVVGFKNVAWDSEQDLISAESQQPVSITIEAGGRGSSSRCTVGLPHGGAVGLKVVNHRQRASLDVGFETANLVSILHVWRAHRVMWCEHRPRCPC